MRIPGRLRSAFGALQLTRADADEQRRRSDHLAIARTLETNGVAGQLSEDVEQWAPFVRFSAPGQFYSPIPRLDAIEADADRIWAVRTNLPGIDLRLTEQRALVARIALELGRDALPDDPSPEQRYYARNPAFGIGDATMLYGILRVHRPSRIVEIGSGHSSALILDVVSHYLPETAATFVEPYPDLLRSLMQPGDEKRCVILEQRAQDLPMDVVGDLVGGDVLFIDSTHVLRTGSDVCQLILEVLPVLRAGVIVHVHDIFWPFEMPRGWVEEGRQWAECYLLRAFLTSNPEWDIMLFNDYLGRYEKPLLERVLPQFLDNPGGSLWLRKVV